jgi:hypothetical protein
MSIKRLRKHAAIFRSPAIACILICLLGSWFSRANEPPSTILRWTEGNPGCTFSADDDGKYRYGIWTDDLGVVIAVDADEVRNASLRIEPLFALFVTLRYRSNESVSIDPRAFSLEFVNHYHTIQKAIDPDEFADTLQRDTATVAAKQQESRTRTLTGTADFVKSRSLRASRLDPQTTETSGWVFFNAKSKWIGNWKTQEQFVLRIPVAGRTFEFPFALPPSPGDLLLRRR